MNSGAEIDGEQWKGIESGSCLVITSEMDRCKNVRLYLQSFSSPFVVQQEVKQ